MGDSLREHDTEMKSVKASSNMCGMIFIRALPETVILKIIFKRKANTTIISTIGEINAHFGKKRETLHYRN